MKKTSLLIISFCMVLFFPMLVSAQCYPVYDLAPLFLEGETQTYSINFEEYVIVLQSVNKDSVIVSVNGRRTTLDLCSSQTFNDLTITPFEVVDKAVTFAFAIRSEQASVCFPQGEEFKISYGETKTVIVDGSRHTIRLDETRERGVTAFVVDGVPYAPRQTLCQTSFYDFKDGRLSLTTTQVSGSTATVVASRNSYEQSCPEEYHLRVVIRRGETKTYTVEGSTYDIGVHALGSQIKFFIDGQITPALTTCQAIKHPHPEQPLWVVAEKISGDRVSVLLRADGVVVKKEEQTLPEKEVVQQDTQTTSQTVEKEEFFEEKADENTKVLQESVDEKKPVEQTKEVRSCEQGCLYETSCLPIGTRIHDSRYCSLEQMLKQQLIDGSSCNNNYECLSNQCYNDLCLSLEQEVRETKNLLERISDWFSRLF